MTTRLPVIIYFFNVVLFLINRMTNKTRQRTHDDAALTTTLRPRRTVYTRRRNSSDNSGAHDKNVVFRTILLVLNTKMYTIVFVKRQLEVEQNNTRDWMISNREFVFRRYLKARDASCYVRRKQRCRVVQRATYAENRLGNTQQQ